MPTDTVWGILSINENLIYQFKKRDKSKKIIKFIGKKFINNFPKNIQILTDEFWPGPLTIIYKSVAYRMPDQKEILWLLNDINEIYCSSANISGLPVVTSIEEIYKYWSQEIKEKKAIIWNVKNTQTNNIPSTIYDYDNHKIIRTGTISEEMIFNKIKKF